MGLAPLQVPFDGSSLAAALTGTSCYAAVTVAADEIRCWDVTEPTLGIWPNAFTLLVSCLIVLFDRCDRGNVAQLLGNSNQVGQVGLSQTIAVEELQRLDRQSCWGIIGQRSIINNI